MWNKSKEYASVAYKLVTCSLLVFSVKLIRTGIKAKRLTGSVGSNTLVYVILVVGGVSGL